MRIFLLCNSDPLNAAMVSDHINAFPLYSINHVDVFTHTVANSGHLPDEIELDLYDVVIVHYSLFIAINSYLSNATKQKLKKFKGVKAIFLQDEYRFVNSSVKTINDVGFDVIFTCVPEESIEKVYPKEKLPGVKKINVLTGYVPESLLSYSAIPIEKRKYDVSYRGRVYPAWHGRLGLEKWKIGEKFLKDSKKYGIKCDINCKESGRVYGRDWVALIQESKAVLGVESGASVFDFTGEISSKVESEEELLGADGITYEQLREKYFRSVEDQISFAQISPRTFEAIALKTACILYEGSYSGILFPWRHYIPLKKDHSNMTEVVAALNDTGNLSVMITNAYAEIAINPKYSYSYFIKNIDRALEELVLLKNNLPNINDNSKTPKKYQELETILEKYPFYLFANPHALNSRMSPKSMFLTFLKYILPRGSIKLIRSILGR